MALAARGERGSQPDAAGQRGGTAAAWRSPLAASEDRNNMAAVASYQMTMVALAARGERGSQLVIPAHGGRVVAAGGARRSRRARIATRTGGSSRPARTRWRSPLAASEDRNTYVGCKVTDWQLQVALAARSERGFPVNPPRSCHHGTQFPQLQRVLSGVLR